MRVFAISDLHIDYDDNMNFVYSLSALDHSDDLLIVAGDLSHQRRKIYEAFNVLVNKFRKVCFVPGNHDLWVNTRNDEDSLEKFLLVQEIAEESGVITNRLDFEAVTIVPLLSWYDFSFGTPTAKLRAVWADFYRIKWPDDATEQTTNWRFMEANEARLYPTDRFVISYSHFLPRLDVMPSEYPDRYKYLYPVLGSWRLDRQIRELGSKIHVYGHSHLNRDVEIQGVRYINNALGYPSEYSIARRQLLCIYDDTA